MKPWYKSLKFYTFAVGVSLVLANEYHLLSPEALEKICQLTMVFLGAQGAADFGKNKPLP